MRASLGPGPFRLLLDLGTGTGRILELFYDRIERGLGFDTSQAMLAYARAKLSRGARAARRCATAISITSRWRTGSRMPWSCTRCSTIFRTRRRRSPRRRACWRPAGGCSSSTSRRIASSSCARRMRTSGWGCHRAGAPVARRGGARGAGDARAGAGPRRREAKLTVALWLAERLADATRTRGRTASARRRADDRRQGTQEPAARRGEIGVSFEFFHRSRRRWRKRCGVRCSGSPRSAPSSCRSPMAPAAPRASAPMRRWPGSSARRRFGPRRTSPASMQPAPRSTRWPRTIGTRACATSWRCGPAGEPRRGLSRAS